MRCHTVQGVYEGLANFFRSGDPHIVACTFNHRRPFEVAVDFDTPESRKGFVVKYNNQQVSGRRDASTGVCPCGC